MQKPSNACNILKFCFVLGLCLAPIQSYAETSSTQKQNSATQVLGQDDVKQLSPEEIAAEQRKYNAQLLFEESLNLLKPLSDDQIREFREFSHKQDRAMSPVTPALKSRTVRVRLEPGGQAVKVNTTANIATAIVFHDVSGAPWAVTSVTNGSPTLFQVMRPELPEANLLNVLPLQSNASSTLIVTLEGKDVPLIISLHSDSVKGASRSADSMVLVQLAHMGPNAEVPVVSKIEETVTTSMLAFLDLVPPSGSVKLKFTPEIPNFQAWQHENKFFVRTKNALVWPAWNASVNGASSIKCYELMKTSRILLSVDGTIHTLELEQNHE